ncbi:MULTISPECIES: LysR family transcriptional regulator [Burkholderia cepacia complex]|uniref:LysR family transcriptional regulator n=1 Tax=Burkholderia cepacia complex TaxID=87882 RepID=UPI001CF2C062|nr:MULTISPECIES: LysR family transcriptional regulator [Burkholderia cepacia complex]MCA8057385.1 LysR family transcriptional regulator [Burkholderia cepacia]MDN7535210.1 LysR family transcriptional regulator [Burkholderia orbicola]
MERGSIKTAHLRTLVAIAEHGTLMAAADALCLSQPAVTKSIKDLEARLGVQLMVRGGAGVRMTPYGEALLKRARTVVAEIARAELELEDMKSSADRTLTIGVSLLAAPIAVPSALRAFRNRMPDAKLNVYECLPTQIIDGLRDGTFDVCVAFVAESDVTAEFRVIPLSRATQSLAVRRGDPLAREERLARLAEARWLYNHTRESLPAFWRELCGNRFAPLPRRISVCTSQRLYAELAQEPGVVSVWPDFLLDEQIQRGHMTRITTDAEAIWLTLGLMHRKDLVLSTTTEYFVGCMCDAARANET